MSVYVARPVSENSGTVLIGEKYAGLFDSALQNLGVTPLYVPDNPSVDRRLSGHADLSVFYGGGERVFLAPHLRETAFHHRLLQLGFEPVFPKIIQGAEYPQDVQLNACVAGKWLIYSSKSTANEIVDYLTINLRMQPVPVRQGYAGCAVCPVDERSLITADRGIARAAARKGMDVLLIAPGYVELPGFSTGLIGGAAFRLPGGHVAFTGVLDGHPDRENILTFLRRQGLKAVFLTDRPLFDIGSAIPLFLS